MTIGFYIPGSGPTAFSPIPDLPVEAVTEKIILLSPRLVERSALTCRTQVASLQVTNLQNQETAQVYRTTSNVEQWVAFTLPAVTVVNAVAMAWNQGILSSSALWRAYIYETTDDMLNDENEVVDTGWQSVWPGPDHFKHSADNWGPEVALLRIDNDQAYRYVKVWITDPDAPQAYLDISRMAVGTAAQFRINPRIDGGINFVPIDVQEPNGYGQIFTDPRPWQQRQFVLVWSSLAEQDVQADAMELSRLRGQAGDFFVFQDPGAIEDFHWKSMQAIFEGQHKFMPANIYVPGKDGKIRRGWGFTFTCTQKL